MTKQEFKIAFKLMTGKDFGYNTEVPCEDGIILKTYKFYNDCVTVDFMRGELLDFKKPYNRYFRVMNYEKILKGMKK